MTLTVVVRTSAQDSAIARALGLSIDGPLPGAAVEARRAGSSDRATGLTDADGRAVLAGLLPGTWSVTVGRLLSEVERQQLPMGDQDVTAWAGSFAGAVNASATVPVSADAGRRGALVISEVYEYGPPTAEWLSHPFGSYVELYNNSDTTIYLDGMLLGRLVPNWERDYETEGSSCAATSALRLDQRGIWARELWRFPGGGTQYALGPGEARIVAIDAMDHRVFNVDLLDLSTADFEQFGDGSDVDNPAVPNLRPLAPTGLQDHGTGFHTAMALFIGTGAVRDSTWLCPQYCIPIHLVTNVLDVVTFDNDRAIPGVRRQCVPILDTRFEQAAAPISNRSMIGALARRVAFSVSGRPVLLRTRNSARDWGRTAAPSPQRVP